ncbi:uncharacterized protein LOC18443902 isoform X1 [Amborella trichopoda]|uniref:uncharacterized protein LOC18443902 isoform X1 n=2 Tax=Amborella trichopoda TaxID=13333 RepID=UPI0009C12242|nr:uncharacterized protein LOC18443902 isoform X1 [Amborella trichopoda]|eukprot:XP_020529013.1 uncharacterized protein LOC18443902 isoform X1 [Amborella trichopoda]
MGKNKKHGADNQEVRPRRNSNPNLFSVSNATANFFFSNPNPNLLAPATLNNPHFLPNFVPPTSPDFLRPGIFYNPSVIPSNHGAPNPNPNSSFFQPANIVPALSQISPHSRIGSHGLSEGVVQGLEIVAQKVHRDLLASGTGVLAWKVIKPVLFSCGVESLSDLGHNLQRIPTLQKLIFMEGKVNAFIHCFVGVRRITTLYELNSEVCKSEGLDNFEDLTLGPLLQNPLVRDYFSVASDVMEFPKITSQDIISHLSDFMNICKDDDIQVKGFLAFLARKLAFKDPAKLCIRIESLGMHLKYIREAKSLEQAPLQILVETARLTNVQTKEQPYNIRAKQGKEDVPHNTAIQSQMHSLDKRFNVMSKRMKSFFSGCKDSKPNHIRFISSSSDGEDVHDEEDDTGDDNSKRANGNSIQKKREEKSCGVPLSTCPYPSAAEEMIRLGMETSTHVTGSSANGLSGNISKKSSKRKRKVDKEASMLDSSQKCLKTENNEKGFGDPKHAQYEALHVDSKETERDQHTVDTVSHFYRSSRGKFQVEICSFELPRKSLEAFVSFWKETCQEHSVTEVFERMMLSYKDLVNSKKLMKLLLQIFSSNPFLGLLNIAVISIKSGMWDSLYGAFQDMDDQFMKPNSAQVAEVIHVGPSKKVPILGKNCSSNLGNGLDVNDIIEKVSEFYKSGCAMVGEKKLSLERPFESLKKFLDCEKWLAEQFSVESFGCLGYGSFFEFLYKHHSLLPFELSRDLAAETVGKFPITVFMFHSQVRELLLQAQFELGNASTVTKDQIVTLLQRQFPLVSFEVAGTDLEDDFIWKHNTCSSSRRVLYSVTLLRPRYNGDPLLLNGGPLPESAGSLTESGQTTGSLGVVTGNDAIKCLLKAPILSDLQAWSHWDLVFAPTLGPLLDWLLSGVSEELFSIVSKDGKLIRIDHLATVDGFLEAVLQGSARRTAAQLLSVFALYGGINRSPVSLLKCYARQGIQVMVKNYIDSLKVTNNGKLSSTIGEAFIGQKILNIDSANSLSPDSPGSSLEGSVIAAKFILECLIYLPPEFCSSAADILLSGLRFTATNAPATILHECIENYQIDQRVMLHDIGFSLGILEWIDDYHIFSSCFDTWKENNTESPTATGVNTSSSIVVFPADGKVSLNPEAHIAHLKGQCDASTNHDCIRNVSTHTWVENLKDNSLASMHKDKDVHDAAQFIEAIRREEFGLDATLDQANSSLLEKQHARLGRALQCLSRELYSQDSHFLLELVQNADDNMYPENVDPTLVFIFQPTNIVVLNNERGFSAQNIKALCDIGSSTKKGFGAGYIGQKGIGFKSVFRVTNAPEIHSNGFHVKFDISKGQIGFVLPTNIPPCDMKIFNKHVTNGDDQLDTASWNTCIVLPFKSKPEEGIPLDSLMSMFSDLHPSLLLFLHRLRCIIFRNLLNDSITILRRESVGNGIIRVSHGNQRTDWLVVSQELKPHIARTGVQSTEIALAFTLQESPDEGYTPHLELQPVFAYLPLRTYGLKFILQGDFILPSSREEVDGDSAWNQWLLSEFPTLFVNAERCFCALPCFQGSSEKAVTAYFSFVPMPGEVHGFFSQLPQMIISKLRASNCLLLDRKNAEWVPPCKVLKGWDEQVRCLIPESLLFSHLGLGYLHQELFLSDPLANALGVQSYGPKILFELMVSLCRSHECIKSMGLDWLISWLVAFHASLSIPCTIGQSSFNGKAESQYICALGKIPFIPLSDGSYSSLEEGSIWMPCRAFSDGLHDEPLYEEFPYLYAELRTVNPRLISSRTLDSRSMEENQTNVVISMLRRIGVQRLSAHEVVRSHILKAIPYYGIMSKDKCLMAEYLAFTMLHLQSNCESCHIEKAEMISELQNKAIVLTSNGYKCPGKESIHFTEEFGSHVDIKKIIEDTGVLWNEIDNIYLNYPAMDTSSSNLVKWRNFFVELGVTDFVQIIQVDREIVSDFGSSGNNSIFDGNHSSSRCIVKDWEAPELVNLLTALSSCQKHDKCEYLLKVLDDLWDDYFSTKVARYGPFHPIDNGKPCQLSFIKCMHQFKWVVSTMDKELHYPKDLFYDCEIVRSILGPFAPYVVPQVKSKKFLDVIGFKTRVTLDAALAVLQSWRSSKTPFRASIKQMSRFYSFIWDEMTSTKTKIEALNSGACIFVPFAKVADVEQLVPGVFLSTSEVYWSDQTGCVDRTREILLHHAKIDDDKCNSVYTLIHFYGSSLHDFFVDGCGVREVPRFGCYLQLLLQLSRTAPPSQSANVVSQVFLKLADDIQSGLVESQEISHFKDCLCKTDFTILPTILDRWVSLHQDFGVICWCDDEELRKQFKSASNLDFVHFGGLDEGKGTFQVKLAALMGTIGVPVLSEVVSREAKFYGVSECEEKALLVNWIIPYVQRYIYELHPETYLHLKISIFESLNQLQVIGVEKLFYKRMVKSCYIASRNRYQCSCLLEGTTLYLTQDANNHSIFLELSRVFFGGRTDLHLANFLHMIATMSEWDSAEEQIESFIIKNQKVPKLPSEEVVWVTPQLSRPKTSSPLSGLPPIMDECPSNSKPKPGITSCWPPADWKAASKIHKKRKHVRWAHVKPLGESLDDSIEQDENAFAEDPMVDAIPIEIDDDFMVEDDSAASTALALEHPNSPKDEIPSNETSEEETPLKEAHNEPNDKESTSYGEHIDGSASTLAPREQLRVGTPNKRQQLLTGRLGEVIAYTYFIKKYGSGAVKWVNQGNESGLPYDVVVTLGETGNKEYIEVKSTSSRRKDFFEISVKEWNFAMEKRDSYSIAHVVVAPNRQDTVTVLKNPLKLCQLGKLKLAILMHL